MSWNLLTKIPDNSENSFIIMSDQLSLAGRCTALLRVPDPMLFSSSQSTPQSDTPLLHATLCYPIIAANTEC